MPGKQTFVCIYFLMLVVIVPAYAASGVEVNGDLNLSGTGTISFPDGTSQTTAATDCIGRYELNSNPFSPNGDGTVTDCRTGSIWLKNARCTDTSGGIQNINGNLTWDNAKLWAAGLSSGLCGLTDGSDVGDWRLPTKLEWMAMVQSARNRGYTNPALTNAAGTGHWTPGNIFDNVQTSGYWSGSSIDADLAWIISMIDGIVADDNKPSSNYVWPVRSGQ